MLCWLLPLEVIRQKKRAWDEEDQRLRLRPDYSPVLVERIMPFKRREDLDHFIEGLHKAGLPA